MRLIQACVDELITAPRLRRPAFQLLWHKPFPNAQQLFDICATERLFVSQHADFQASSHAEGSTCLLSACIPSDLGRNGGLQTLLLCGRNHYAARICAAICRRTVAVQSAPSVAAETGLLLHPRLGNLCLSFH